MPPVDDLVKDIASLKLSAVQTRLKTVKPNQKYTDPKTKQIYTPLHAAVKCKAVQIVQALIKDKADVNAVDSQNATPLHWATEHNDIAGHDIAAALIKAGAKLDVADKAGRTPLHLAAERGNGAIIPALAAGQAAMDEPLGGAAGGGLTAVHLAVKAGHMGVVGELVKAGAKPGITDAAGFTPLMRLLQSGQASDVRTFLELGNCNLDAQEPETGHSVLMMVVMGQTGPGGGPDLGLVDALLESGASPDLQDGAAGKVTPIMAAIRGGHREVALRLVKSSKNVNAMSGKGESALSLALEAGLNEVVAALLSCGADVARDGPAALKTALDKKDDTLAAELVRLMPATALKAAGVSASGPLLEGGLPRAGVTYMSRFEVDAAGKLPVDGEGNTKLHALAEAGAGYEVVLAVARASAQLGIDINALNKGGDTALHIAALKGHLDACRGLVDGGADPLRRNGKNRRPREQPKCPESTKEYLGAAEDAAKEAKASKQSELWDEKMRATQTESAFGLRVV